MSSDNLTPEQKKTLKAYCDKWTKIALSTERANEPAAEAAVKTIYAKHGLREPTIIWGSSPFTCGIARAMFVYLLEQNQNQGENSVSQNAMSNRMKEMLDEVKQRTGKAMGEEEFTYRYLFPAVQTRTAYIMTCLKARQYLYPLPKDRRAPNDSFPDAVNDSELDPDFLKLIGGSMEAAEKLFFVRPNKNQAEAAIKKERNRHKKRSGYQEGA